MFKKISDWFYKNSSGKILIFLFVGFLLFTVFSFPVLYRIFPQAMEMVSLDDMKLHSPTEILNIVDSWGVEGRNMQFWFHLTGDIVIPVLYFLFFGMLISFLLKRGLRPDSQWRYLNLIVLGAFFDILENIFIAVLIKSYPARLIAIAWMKNFFTICKYGTGAMIFAVIMIALIVFIKNRFKN